MSELPLPEIANAAETPADPLPEVALSLVGQSMAPLEDVPLELVMELARIKITIRDLLELAPGSMLKLPAADCDSVRVSVGQLCIARGEIASRDNCYSVRVIEITEDVETCGERS